MGFSISNRRAHIKKWKRPSIHAPPASDITSSFCPKIHYMMSCDVILCGGIVSRTRPLLGKYTSFDKTNSQATNHHRSWLTLPLWFGLSTSWRVMTCHWMSSCFLKDFWWLLVIKLRDIWWHELDTTSDEVLSLELKKFPGTFYWQYTWGCINSCVSNNLMLGVQIIICNLVLNSL